jgi:hypothetical protein
MAEQWTFNPLVQGSSPWRPTPDELAFYIILGPGGQSRGIIRGIKARFPAYD